MKSKNKLTAVLSAAALMAMGASMTSFAAGWQQNEAGTWNYFSRDDEMTTSQWQKDGGRWFYLDDEGAMLTDSWVDGEYYVGEDGAMLINQWKKTTADEEMDDPENGGENWYYFGSKGKKTTGREKIGEKNYYFDKDTGKMQKGWYEDPDSGALYYYGEEDDGARASGWRWLDRPCTNEDRYGGEVPEESWCKLCDEEGWYYFGSDGKMYSEGRAKRINGKSFIFNYDGQMLYEWVNNSFARVVASNANAKPDGGEPASPDNAQDMLYINPAEEGWRADGWYQIDGSSDTGSNGETSWYYFKDGVAKKASASYENSSIFGEDGEELYRAIVNIDGKKFCFDNLGRMQTGLQAVWDTSSDYAFYYFDDNGYMKYGKVADVEEANGSYTYYFNTKSGKGVTGLKNGYLYYNGKRLEADEDYKLYNIAGTVYLVDKKGKAQKSATKEYAIENDSFDGEKYTIGTKSSSSYEIVRIGDQALYQEDGSHVVVEADFYPRPLACLISEAPAIELQGSCIRYYDVWNEIRNEFDFWQVITFE